MNAANDEGLSGLSPNEINAIQSVLDGASFADAANSAGLLVDHVECIWTRHHIGLKEAMKQAAKLYMAQALASSPEDAMDDILAELGLLDLDLYPQNEANRR